MRTTLVSLIAIFVVFGCHHKPPVTSGNPNKRQPINSQEQAARLAFCAELGVGAGEAQEAEEEVPASVPAPVQEEPPTSSPAPVAVAPVAPPAPKTSYTMVVLFSKGSSTFKPSPEQIEELKPYLKGAERIEVKVRSDARQSTPAEEKLVWARAFAAKDFLVAQGAAPAGIWLNVLSSGDYVDENTTDEGQAQNRRVEIQVYGGAL